MAMMIDTRSSQSPSTMPTYVFKIFIQLGVGTRTLPVGREDSTADARAPLQPLRLRLPQG